MERRVRPTGTGLFMIELVMAVGIFALCAAVCVGLFVRAETLSRGSADRDQAVAAARSASEAFRARGGDLEAAAQVLEGARIADGSLVVGYDESWRATASGAVYTLTLAPVEAEGYALAAVTVTGGDGETLAAWEVAALEAAS